VIYTLNVKGADIQVCKNKLMAVRCLQNSRSLINNVNRIAEGRRLPNLMAETSMQTANLSLPLSKCSKLMTVFAVFQDTEETTLGQ
jgi:hypothetical protein